MKVRDHDHKVSPLDGTIYNLILDSQSGEFLSSGIWPLWAHMACKLRQVCEKMFPLHVRVEVYNLS